LTLEKLIERAKMIEHNQLIGRIVPELNQQDIREIISGNYRIIYQNIETKLSYILTIHHSLRLFIKSSPNILGQ